MKSKTSITKLYTFILVIVVFLVITILGSIAIYKEYSSYQTINTSMRKKYVDAQKHIVKHEVERACEYIKIRRANPNISEEELKKEVLEWFSKIRFHNRGNEEGILFVRSYEGIILMSTSTPEMIGKNTSDLTDPDGINTHKQFMKIIQDPDGGYAEYSWFNPAVKKVGRKMSFVKGVPEWNLYIGAGFWYDDVDNLIARIKLQMYQDIKDFIVKIIFLMFVMFIFSFLIIYILSKKIKTNFAVFTSFFNKAATQSSQIDLKEITFKEFSNIAVLANEMVQKRVEVTDKLNLSEIKYRALFEDAGDCILITDIDGNIIDFNKHAYEDYGYSKEEFSKMKVSDLEAIESVDKVKFHLRKISAIGYENFASKHKKKNGSVIDVLISAKEIIIDDRTYIQSIYRNVDDYKTVSQKLRKTEEKYQGLYKNALVAMFSTELKDGKAISANSEAAKLFGYPSIEEFKKNFRSINHYANPDDREPLLKELRDKGHLDKVLMHSQKVDGTLIWNEASFRLDKETGYIDSVSIDVTERKNIENKLKQHKRNLEDLVSKRTAKLEEKNTDLEKLNKLFVNREQRIKELREQLKKYKK